MFTVWFACTTCRESFQKLEFFLEHKILNHFEEIRNTKYIVFEERRIQTQNTDLEKIKIENESKFQPSSLEFPCDTIQNVGLIKTENQSIDHDCVGGSGDFLSSKNVTSTNSNFDLKPAESTTVYISQKNPTVNDSYCANQKFLNLKPDPEFEIANNAASNLNASELGSDFSPTQIIIESPKNPFVLVRRLTSQEIQNYSAPENASSSSFQCNLCLHKFKSDLELNSHVKACVLSHQHRRRFCALCNKKFYCRRCLLRHISKRHEFTEGIEEFKKFKHCKHCTKSFLYESELKRHAISHINKHERPFKCLIPHCSKTFKTTVCVQYHIRTAHSEERPFKCLHTNCEKSFKLKCHLRNHQLTHSNQALFKCPNGSCPKAFKSRGSLLNHIIMHSNLRPFKCPTADCKKAFKIKYQLKRHLALHSEGKPFKCLNKIPFKCPEIDCGKSFNSRISCWKHKVVHSKATQYQCFYQNCGKTFKTGNNLNRHLKCSPHSDSS